MSDVLEFADVTVRRGQATLIDRISWRVEEPDRWVILGPNGAGKTTLVRAVLGLLKPDSGTVRRKTRLRIGYLPQKLHVDPTLPLSVLRFLRLVPGVDRSAAAAALAEVGASQVIDSPLQSISGGELQRVLLARALLREPQLLVLDEPVQGVDVAGQADSSSGPASDGDTAPMSSPIGAWMRAMSLSLAPCARKRSARLAWVLREPSAPT